MGFRSGAYAKVWSVETVSDKVTRCRVSVSRKNQDGDGYTQQFSGFVSFLGTAAASKAAKLKESDTIRFNDVDVTTNYDKERNINYTNFICYDFDTPNSEQQGQVPTEQGTPQEDFSDVAEGQEANLPW